MGPEEKAIVDATAKAALVPFTDVVSTVFGVLGHDWLKEYQKRNQDKFARRTAEIFRERDLRAAPPPPTILLPLLEAAQNESRDELIEIWARLLAAASDPQRASQFRSSYIAIAKDLEPIDALLLPFIDSRGGSVIGTGDFEMFASQTGFSRDQIAVAIANLYRLALVSDSERQIPPVLTRVLITATGREFCKAIADK